MSVWDELMSSHSLPTIEVRQPKPGLRHNQSEKLVYHRFPVKGGITSDQVLIRLIEKNNALLSHMLSKGKIKSAEEVARGRMHRRRTRAQRT